MQNIVHKFINYYIINTNFDCNIAPTTHGNEQKPKKIYTFVSIEYYIRYGQH